jgi:hypothetical protein
VPVLISYRPVNGYGSELKGASVSLPGLAADGSISIR